MIWDGQRLTRLLLWIKRIKCSLVDGMIIPFGGAENTWLKNSEYSATIRQCYVVGVTWYRFVWFMVHLVVLRVKGFIVVCGVNKYRKWISSSIEWWCLRKRYHGETWNWRVYLCAKTQHPRDQAASTTEHAMKHILSQLKFLLSNTSTLLVFLFHQYQFLALKGPQQQAEQNTTYSFLDSDESGFIDVVEIMEQIALWTLAEWDSILQSSELNSKKIPP